MTSLLPLCSLPSSLRRPALWIGLALAAAAGLRHAPVPGGDAPIFDRFRLAWLADPALDAGESLLHAYEVGGATGVSLKMPLYSLSAAVLTYHSGAGAGAAAALGLMAVLPCALLFALGCLLHSAACGVLSAAWFALAPSLSSQQAPAYQLYASILLTIACAAAWRAREPSAAKGLLLHSCIGASLLYRSPLALLPPLWAAYDRLAMRRPRRDLLLCLVPFLFLLPWIGMNQAIHGTPIAFEHPNAMASNLVSGATGLVPTIEGDWMNLIDAPPRRAHRPGALSHWAAREMLRHPLRTLRAGLARIAYAASLQPVLFAAALAGFWVFRRREGFRQVGFLAGYYLVVHCLFSVQPGYFAPLWPLLLPAAAAALLPVDTSAGHSLGAERAARAVTASSACALLIIAMWALSVVHRYRLRVTTVGTPAALAEASSSHPDDPWLCSQRGYAALRQGDLRRAWPELVNAVRIRPSHPGHRLDLAWALFLKGLPDVLLRYPAAEARGLVRARAWLLKAVANLKAGDTAKARALLDTLSENPNGYPALVRRLRTEQERKALARLQAQPASLGSLLRGLPYPLPPADALPVLKLLARARPSDAGIWLAYAETHLREGDPRAAREVLERGRGAGFLGGYGRHAERLYRELIAHPR
ncbi:MAG: hypothetical protein HY554_04440 [Elusimicrobia bacterium]|nr:hypothetical protein [Elusimicrobiota bacterium]